MKSCNEVSQLLSEAMDRKLSRRERLGLWFHLGMCKLCSGFSTDLQTLRSAARLHAKHVEQQDGPPGAALTAEARARIKQALQNEQR